MSRYTTRSGDTLGRIALVFYGDARAADQLAVFNDIPDPDTIPVGLELAIPRKLVSFDRLSERGRVRSTIDSVIHSVSVPLTFYADYGAGVVIARRRFVYAWKKDFEEGWVSLGVLLTDDIGRPWLAEEIAKHEAGASVEVFTRPVGAGGAESLPFAFYSPRVAQELDLSACSPGKQLIVSPGETYAFMYSPLDVVRGRDSALPHDDPRGFGHPATYRSQHRFDVEGLVADGLAVEFVVPKFPELEPEPLLSLRVGQPDPEALTAKVQPPLTLAERASLIGRQVYVLDEAVKRDLEAKREYSRLNASLNDASYVLDLMKRVPRSHDLDSEELDEIARYQQHLHELSTFIEEEFLGSSEVYEVTAYQEEPTSQESTGGPTVLERAPDLFEERSIKELAGELLSMLREPSFKEELFAHLDRVKAQDFADADENFFSFKHPIVTVLDLLNDAFSVIAHIPDREVAEQAYQQEVRPFEQMLLAEFHEDAELVDQTCTLVSEVLGDLDHAGDHGVDAMVREKSGEKTEGTLWTKVWAVVEDAWKIASSPHVTGFWNNQEGAPSTMSRILEAFARHRNRRLAQQSTIVVRVTIEQLKIYMVMARRVALGAGIELTQVRYYYRSLTTLRVSAYRVRPSLIDVEEFKKAPKVLNRLASGIQLVAAVMGIVRFAETEEPTRRDYANLVDSVSNAGLAFSGLAPKQWSGALRLRAAGKLMAGAGMFVTFYTASLDASRHMEFGEGTLTMLSCARAALALVGGASWVWAFATASAMSGPIGWAVFAGLLLLEAGEYVYVVSRTGTHRYLHDLIQGIDDSKEELLWKRHGSTITFPRGLAPQVLVGKNHTYCDDARPQEVIYAVEFPGLFVGPAGKDYGALWDDHIKKIGVESVTLDHEKATPLLARRGWPRERVLSLMADGRLVGEDDDVRKAKVGAIYDAERNAKEPTQRYREAIEAFMARD